MIRQFILSCLALLATSMMFDQSGQVHGTADADAEAEVAHAAPANPKRTAIIAADQLARREAYLRHEARRVAQRQQIE